MAEAQLIGRGARYYPFMAPQNTDGPREKRKFDRELNHPLRLLEELYYHCSHNPKYIDDIKRALVQTGARASDERRVQVKVKDSFKSTKFFRQQLVYLNQRRRNDRENVVGIEDYVPASFMFPVILTGNILQSSAFDSRVSEDAASEIISTRVHLSEIDPAIIRFAIDSNSFFHFCNLQRHFPNLRSIREFMTSESYLGGARVVVRGSPKAIAEIESKDLIRIVQFILREIEIKVKSKSYDFIGTRDFKPSAISSIVVDKEIKVRRSGEQGLSWSESEIPGLHAINLHAADWHVYDDNFGTNQEKYFLRFIHEQASRLRQIYEEFYVIRNEKLFQLYNFEDGQPFEPDFLMFLKRSADGREAVFQVFIEPKGGFLSSHDAWKEAFLSRISEVARIEVILQNHDFKIIGLPFFNEAEPNKSRFELEFDKLVTAV